MGETYRSGGHVVLGLQPGWPGVKVVSIQQLQNTNLFIAFWTVNHKNAIVFALQQAPFFIALWSCGLEALGAETGHEFAHLAPQALEAGIEGVQIAGDHAQQMFALRPAGAQLDLLTGGGGNCTDR